MKLRHTDPVAVAGEGLRAALRGETLFSDPVKGAAITRAMLQIKQSPGMLRQLGALTIAILVQHHSGPFNEELQKRKDTANEGRNT